MRHPLKTKFLLVALVICASACNERPLQAPQTLQDVTDEETQEYASRLISALHSCTPAALSDAFDLEAAERRGLRASSLNNRLQTQAMAEIMSVLTSQRGALFYCHERTEETVLEVVRTRHFRGRSSVVVRMREDGYKYWEFVIGKDGHGRVFADDLYDHSEGQFVSERVKARFDTFAADAKHGTEIRNTLKLLSTSPVEGLEKVKELTVVTQQSKMLRLATMLASGSLGPDAFRRSLAEFQRNYPEHPSLAFVEFDAYLNNQDYPAALEALLRFEKEIGPDTGIKELRVATMLFDGRELTKALQLARELDTEFPDRATGLGLQLSIQLKLRDHAATAKTLRTQADRFGSVWTPELVHADEDFSEFVKTNEWREYQVWLNENFEFVDESDATEERGELVDSP